MRKRGRPYKNMFDYSQKEKNVEEINIKMEGDPALPEEFQKFEHIPKSQKLSSSIVFEKETHLAFKKWCLDNKTNFSETIYYWILKNCKDYLPKK